MDCSLRPQNPNQRECALTRSRNLKSHEALQHVGTARRSTAQPHLRSISGSLKDLRWLSNIHNSISSTLVSKSAKVCGGKIVQGVCVREA